MKSIQTTAYPRNLLLPSMLLALISVSAMPTAAQQTISASPPDMIDGKQSPDLIPDVITYRLYFIATSQNIWPSQQEIQRSNIYLSGAGLRGKEIEAAAAVLANFKTAYKQLQDDYNQSPTVQAATNDGLPAFLEKRDALVQATRDALRTMLPKSSMTLLDAHIQHEKYRTRISSHEIESISARDHGYRYGNRHPHLILVNAAQGGNDCARAMSPAYSAYGALSYDGTNVIATTVTDGTTIIYSGTGCNLNGVLHRGQTTNSIYQGTTLMAQGTGYSAWVPPTGYLTATQPEQIVGVPGVVYMDGEGSQVTCTMVGAFWLASWYEYFEIAFTHSIQTGVRSNCFHMIINGVDTTFCDIGLSNWCSYLTTPPDYTVTAAKKVEVSPVDNTVGGYWNSYTLMGRLSTTGPFNIAIVSFGLNSSDSTMMACTDYNHAHGYS